MSFFTDQIADLKYIYLILSLLICIDASAQDIERQKVGWVYLLTNNIEWPGNPEEYNIRVFTNDQALAVAFKEMEKKRQINDKPIKVSFSNYVTIPDGLQILYVSEGYNNALQSITEGISGKPILVITEKSTDQRYIMLNLTDTPDGLYFQYNQANIVNQGLQPKPDFLELGGEPINVAALYQEARETVKALERKSQNIDESIDTLNMLTAVAMKVGKNLTLQMDQTQAELDRQSVTLRNVQSQLQEREVQLENISNQIAVRNDSIRSGAERLVAQEEEIGLRNQAIVKKEAELRTLNLILDNQLEILLFLIFFALLILLALFLSYKAYHARRRDAKKLNEQKEELDELLEKLQSTQTQLIHAEQLSAVGELSESIAHEVNNASNYILSGIHVMSKKHDEVKSLMNIIKSLDENESMLKTKMKVREAVERKREIEYDGYESVTKTMVNSIVVGADRIKSVLKDLTPYMRYGELGKFGMALLGGKKGGENESPSDRLRLIATRGRKKKLPRSV